jgi:hypothetical protein
MRVAKTDANHARIMKVLRDAGAEVTSLHKVGQGVPDLLVSFWGKWFLMEVKDPDKPPSARKLTKPQEEWIARQKAEVHIVTTDQSALDCLGIGDWRIALGDDMEKGA